MSEARTAVLQRLAERFDSRMGERYFPYETAMAHDLSLLAVHEALWQLIGAGLVFIDPAGNASAVSWDNWHWRLTERGRAAAGGAWEPNDPQRFIARLRAKAPGIDDAAVLYLAEALEAFAARCFLASSVMLGVAAERAFGRMAWALVLAYPDSTGKLQAALGGRSSQQYRFTEFRKRLEPLRSELPEGMADAIALDTIADLLRISRNEAGHPTGRRIDEDTAYTHLVAAATLLATMTHLAEHFERSAAGP